MVGRSAAAFGYALAVLAGCFLGAGEAFAERNGLQIDWVIPAGQIEAAQHPSKDFATSLSLKLVPRRLYVAQNPVLGGDGQRLLPQGAQLFAMIGERMMACSQQAAPEGYAGANGRVCVYDSNGDGKLDSWFLRSTGKSFMTSDGMWFAMNAAMPSAMSALATPDLAEVSREGAVAKGAIDLDVRVYKDGSAYLEMTIEKKFKFKGDCEPSKPVLRDNRTAQVTCLLPELILETGNLDAVKGRDRSALFHPPARDIGVGFDAADRLFGTRLLERVYFY